MRSQIGRSELASSLDSPRYVSGNQQITARRRSRETELSAIAVVVTSRNRCFRIRDLKLRRAPAFATVLITTCLMLLAPHARAATNKWWDSDGATAGGSGSTTATGTWGTDSFWSTDSTGATATGAWTNGDNAAFSAGGDVTGSYTVTLQAVTTFTVGTLAIEEGNVTFGGSGVISSGANAITVNSGAGLAIDGVSRIATTAGSILTLNGSTLGNISTTNGGTFFDQDTELVMGTGGGTFSYNVASTLQIVETGSKITGLGSLTKTGQGVLAIASTAGNNTYSGGTFVTGGELRVRSGNNVLPTSTAITVTSPGIFNLNGLSQQIGSLAGSGQVGLGSGTLTVGDATSTIYSGLLTDTANAGAGGSATVGGNVTKVGAGVLTISGNDWSNTGTTTINGGAIKYGNAAAGLGNGSNLVLGASGTLDMNNINDTVKSVAGAGSIINGGNLTLAGTNSSTATYSGNFTAGTAVSRTLTKNGSGIQIFSGSNQWTAIAMNGGDLRFNSANASGPSGGTSVPITVGAAVAGDVTGASAGGGIGTSVSGGIDINNAISLTAGSSMDVFATSSNSIRFVGKISGLGALNRTDFGAGDITLSGDNNFSGGLTLISRTLTLGHKNALGTGTFKIGHATQAAASTISFSAASDLSGANAIPNAVTVNKDFTVAGSNNLELAGAITLSAAPTITVTNSAATIFSGAIGGAFAVTKAGAGTLTLINSNTYTNLTLNGGTVALGSDTAAGSGTINLSVAGGTIRSADANTRTLANPITLTLSTVFGSAGTGDLVFSNTLTTGGGAKTITVSNGVTTFNGVITGTTSTVNTKDGSGTLVFGNAANTSTKGLTVNAGTLRAGAAGQAFGVNPAVIMANVAGATLDLAGFNNSIGSLAGGGTTGGNVSLGSGTLTTGGSNASTTYAGVLSGTGGGLTKTGSGTFTLGSTEATANTYTGLTTITAGSLLLNKAANTNAIAGPATAVKNSAANILVDGGTLNWLASNQVGNNVRLDVTSGNVNFGTANETLFDLRNSGGTVNYGTGNVTITDPVWSGGSNTVSGNTTFGTLTVSGGTNTVTGTNSGGAGVLTVGGVSPDLVFTGTTSPNITLSSDNAVAGRLALAGNVTVDSGLTSGTASITSGGGATNPGQLDLGGATRTFTINDGSAPTDFNVSALIVGSGVGITKAGAGTMTVSADNTYNGITTISAGVLSTNSLANGGSASGIGQSLNAAANLVLDGGTLKYTGATVSTNRDYTVTTNGGTIDGSGSGGLTIAGNMTASGSSGAQTLTFTGSASNTHSGTINDGSGSNVTNVMKSGAGTWIFTNGGSNYTGPTTVNGGTLSVNSLADGGSPSAIGQSSNAASNLVLDSGTLKYTGAAVSTDRNYTVGAGGGTIDGSGSGGLTVAGNMTASATSGTQALVLTGSAANTVSGTINNGTGSNVTSLSKTGGGTWTLSNGSSGYSGGTSITAGTLIAGNTSGTAVLGTGTAIVSTAGTLAGTGNALSSAVNVSSGGTISPGSPSATGKLTTGAQTWSSGGSYVVKLNTTGIDQVAGTGFDQLVMSGLSFAISTPKFKIAIGSVVAGGGATFDGTQNYQWTIVDTGASISGFNTSLFTFTTGGFTGNNYDPGSGFNDSNSGTFSLSLSGGGDDIQLNYTAAPEPTSFLLFGAAVLPIFVGRRRRQAEPELTGG